MASRTFFSTPFCTGLLRRRRGSILWVGRQISRSPQETCHDQTSIIGCFFISGVNAKSDGKSPMPSSMTGSEPPNPTPYQPFPQHHESQEQRPSSSSSISSSCTLKRRGSRPHLPYSPQQDHNCLTSPPLPLRCLHLY